MMNNVYYREAGVRYYKPYERYRENPFYLRYGYASQLLTKYIVFCKM